MALGIESFDWQKHTVTAIDVVVGSGTVTFRPLGCDKTTIPIDNLVFIARQKDGSTRVSYYRLACSGGMNCLRQVSKSGCLVTLRQDKTGVEVTINTKFHKPMKNGVKHAG